METKRQLIGCISQNGARGADSSLKRFEHEGLIALDSLLNLALVLNCLDDFDKLAIESQSISVTQSLDALLATPPLRRGATGRKGRSHGV
jgi:hypothetical protein